MSSTHRPPRQHRNLWTATAITALLAGIGLSGGAAHAAPPNPPDPLEPITLTLRASSTTVDAGDPVTLSGTASPAGATTVTIQRSSASGFQTFATTSLTRGGSFSIVVTPPAGTSTFRASVAANRSAGTGAAVSPTVRITANVVQTWTSVSTSDAHTCGIRTNGSLWCWGDTRFGIGGFGSVNRVPARIGTARTWASVEVGARSACAIGTDHSLWCWGENTTGVVGTGTSALTPARVGTATDWATVSVGDASACAVKTDGSLWCWGYNGSWRPTDELFDPSWAQQSPVRVDPGVTYQPNVSVGGSTGCAIRTTGALACWNRTNALYPTTFAPVQVGSGGLWSSVSAGGAHVCGTTIRLSRPPLPGTSALWCWGSNGGGQLGNGATTPTTAPTAVAGSGWSVPTAGDWNSCALQADRLWCWGDNSTGAVGDGTTINRLAPVAVGTDTWSAIASGSGRTCAIKSDKTLWCWGSGDYFGTLGVGDTSNHVTPAQVTG